MTQPDPYNAAETQTPPDQQQQVLPPLDGVVKAHLDLRIAQLHRELQDAFKEALRPLQNNVADLLGQPRSHQPFVPRTQAKANPPPSYDGSRDTGDSFLKACILYIQLNAASFPTDVERIGFILSYMNSGRAATFRDLAIEHLVEKEGQYPWETLKDFSDE